MHIQLKGLGLIPGVGSKICFSTLKDIFVNEIPVFLYFYLVFEIIIISCIFFLNYFIF